METEILEQLENKEFSKLQEQKVLEQKIEILLLATQEKKLIDNKPLYEMRVRQLGYHLTEFYKLTDKYYKERGYFEK